MAQAPDDLVVTGFDFEQLPVGELLLTVNGVQGELEDWFGVQQGVVTVSDIAPVHPLPAQLWWDSVGTQLYIFYADPNSAEWVAVSNQPSGWVNASDAPPANPIPGMLWWDSVGTQLYLYYNDGNSSEWVAANNQLSGVTVPQTGGSSGPTWTTGTGAPSSVQPVGSLYSNTTGAVGSTLYVSRGAGSWNPVAGV